jgi:hypothetical protein
MKKAISAELAALAAMPDEKVDTRDIPEQKDWSGARRGLFFRPIKKRQRKTYDVCTPKASKA